MNWRITDNRESWELKKSYKRVKDPVVREGKIMEGEEMTRNHKESEKNETSTKPLEVQEQDTDEVVMVKENKITTLEKV